MLMNISMCFNMSITYNDVYNYVCSDNMKWHVDWRKIKNVRFLCLCFGGEDVLSSDGLHKLYGNKIPSEYV